MRDDLNSHWHEDLIIWRTSDYAALGLLGFALIGGLGLITYALGDLFGLF